MILVTGATGNVGRNVVHELHALGEEVRAFARDRVRARELLGDDVEIAEGDFADRGSLVAAMHGVERVFLSSADGPEKVAHEAAIVAAAAAEGVRLIVKCSTIGAEAGSRLPPFDWHGRIERHLARSGVRSAVLRSCFYMTNLLASAEQVRATGKLFAPAGDGRVAMIDPRDTAAVAAHVLSDDGHVGREHVLTGHEAIGFSEVASALSAAIGSPVEFVHVPDEAARESLEETGAPGWLVEHLGALFPLIRSGGLAETTDTVRAITGRDARTFAEFATDRADAFTGEIAAGQR